MAGRPQDEEKKLIRKVTLQKEWEEITGKQLKGNVSKYDGDEEAEGKRSIEESRDSLISH